MIQYSINFSSFCLGYKVSFVFGYKVNYVLLVVVHRYGLSDTELRLTGSSNSFFQAVITGYNFNELLFIICKILHLYSSHYELTDTELNSTCQFRAYKNNHYECENKTL